MPLENTYHRRRREGQTDNSGLQNTLSESIHLTPDGHIWDKSSISFPPMGGDNTIATDEASLADQIQSLQSVTISILSGSLPQCIDLDAKFSELFPSFGNPPLAESCSHSNDESSIILDSQGGYNESETEGISFADPINDQATAKNCYDLNAIPSIDIQTPTKPAPLRPDSYVFYEVEGTSFIYPAQDQESTKVNIGPNPLFQCDDLNAKPSIDIETPTKPAFLRSDSYVFYEAEGASFIHPAQDQESTKVNIEPNPLLQCDDLNAKPSIDIETPTKPAPLRSDSYVFYEAEGASFIHPAQDQESTKVNIEPNPLIQRDDLNAKPSIDIETRTKLASLRSDSYVFYEPEGASFIHSAQDQESTKVNIGPNPLIQCDDCNAKPSIDIETPTKPAPLRSDSYVFYEVEGASFIHPAQDQESTKVNIEPNPLLQCDDRNAKPSIDIETPTKPAPLRSDSYVFYEVEGASFIHPAQDQESTKVNIEPNPLLQCDDRNAKPSIDIETPTKPAPLSSDSYVFYEVEGASFIHPAQDQESTKVKIGPNPLLQCDVIDAEPTKPFPSFGIATPASKDHKRKSNDQDHDGRPQKRQKKKVYWPKVRGQPKRRNPPKVSNESENKKRPISVVDGKEKPKRTPKPKIAKKSENSALKVDEGKFDVPCCELQPSEDKYKVEFKMSSTPEEQITPVERTLSNSKTKRSLKFELEENFKELEMPNLLDGLGCKDNSQQLSRGRIPKKKISRRCPLLVKIRKLELNFPIKCKRKRIQQLKPFFQSFERRKRSNNRKRRSNLSILSIWVEETRKKKHGVKEKTKRKKEVGVEEKLKKVRASTLESLIEKFKSLSINDGQTDLVPYISQDGQTDLVLYKSQAKWIVKINLDEETLKMWGFIMDGKAYEENEENKKYWEEERTIYSGRANAFTARMHRILGNRSFSPWKGSVLDSVIGVFLTQNVSDHLSSSAYMSLAATFPRKISFFSGGGKECLFICDKNVGEVKVDGSSNVNNKIEEILNSKEKKVDSPGIIFGKKKSLLKGKKVDKADQERQEKEEEEQDMEYWKSLRRTYMKYCTAHSDHMSFVDWEAVRCADVNKVAKAIEGRGQHNVIAGKIQGFLNKLVELYGSFDLEWLRYAPPDEVKKFLLKVYGLGLKSVECIRLLTLHHNAFPVDVNVGRIAVRLGWVPLEPLPGSIEMHLLDQYPIIDMVQKYLWPRLCTLDQPTLYELHYQMITFGKVFCTKQQPNCNACPMRAECKHFASASRSAKMALPGPQTDAARPSDSSIVKSQATAKSFINTTDSSISICDLTNMSAPQAKECEPIIELPASPDSGCTLLEVTDIEDLCKNDDSGEFITIDINVGEHSKETYNYFNQDEMNMSKALVPLNVNSNFIPVQKLKNVRRLRTERMVYVLPDSHPLLFGHQMREVDDPSPYLLVIWKPEELKKSCVSCMMADDSTADCLFCNNVEENNHTVPGTLLIPCRTAMNGRFPLNGTYFQVNEVFADDESSKNPIRVPREWIWNLETQTTYFGTSTSSILRGASLEQIHKCFWGGFVCVRGIDRKTGFPRPLSHRFHLNTTHKQTKEKKKKNT